MRRTPSWLWPTLLALAVALTPGVSSAKGFGRGGGHGGGRRSSSSSSSSGFGHRSGTSSSGTTSRRRTTYYFQGNGPRYYGSRYREGGGYRPYGYGYGYRDYYDPWAPGIYSGYYGGWGVYPWGYYAYGYYPVWGAPPVDQAPPNHPGPRTTSFSLFFGASAPSQGFAPAGSLSFEGRRWGFNLQGVGLVSVPANPGDAAVYMPLTSAHLTFSVLSAPHARWRLEVGGSGIFAPAVAYVGPDFGTSAQLAIVGPLGVEAAVHYTPLPARIFDAEAGATLSFGGVGLKAGWRVTRLDDRNVGGQGNGGLDIFSGPSISIGLMY